MLALMNNQGCSQQKKACVVCLHYWSAHFHEVQAQIAEQLYLNAGDLCVHPERCLLQFSKMTVL